MGAYGRVHFVLLCTVYILKLASYDNIVIASTISPSGKNSVMQRSSMVVNVAVSSAVEVSSAITKTEGFSSITTSVVSRGPTITVGFPNVTLTTIQTSLSATTAGCSGTVSFTSKVLLSVQASIEPTAASTLKPITTSSVNVDGCKHYKILNGVDRAQGYTLPAQQRCDSDMRLGWYRFQGLAGDQMPDTCVPMLHCGTVAPGWLSGLHPTVADGVVVRKVCFNWLVCCGRSDDIQVRNCGGFFVYELRKPPSCNLRYCGNGSAVITCPALPAPSNGTRLVCPGNATMYYDTVCQFSCNDGYIGSGSQARRCQQNGTWSGHDFTCQIVTCPTLSAPTNGELLGCNTTEMLYNTVCRFSCNEGSEASGSMIRRCTKSGTWSGTSPVCTAVTCPTLSSPTNGEILGCNTTEMLYNTVCRFSCDKGFEAKGSTVRRCAENGTWSGTDLVCTVICSGFGCSQTTNLNVSPVNFFEEDVIGSQSSLLEMEMPYLVASKCYGTFISKT